MIAPLLALFLASTPVHVVDTDDAAVAARVASAVERAIGDRTADLQEVRLHVLTGVTKHLLILELISSDRPKPRTLRISLAADGNGWDAEIQQAVDRVFPPPIVETSTPIPAAEPAQPSLQIESWWGPALIVAGAALVVSASVLAERSAHARRELQRGQPTAADYGSQRASWRSLTIASVTLFGLGALITGGGIFFAFEF